MKFALVIAALAIATPALAEEVRVGVGVGPAGAGVSVGQSRDYDRDRDRERTTVIKEREPTDRTTVIKKEHDDGTRSKTVIKERQKRERPRLNVGAFSLKVAEGRNESLSRECERDYCDGCILVQAAPATTKVRKELKDYRRTKLSSWRC